MPCRLGRPIADLLLGDAWSAGKPLHDAAFLVGHQHQRVSNAVVGLHLNQLAGDRLNLRAVVGVDVLAEEDDADEAGVDECLRWRQTGIGPDDALPLPAGLGPARTLGDPRRGRLCRSGRRRTPASDATDGVRGGQAPGLMRIYVKASVYARNVVTCARAAKAKRRLLRRTVNSRSWPTQRPFRDKGRDMEALPNLASYY